jgi:hypothetical protein
VLDFIFESLQANGFTRTYSYVRGDQPDRLAGAARRLRPVGKLWYLRVCGRSLVLGRRGEALPSLVRPTSMDRLR